MDSLPDEMVNIKFPWTYEEVEEIHNQHGALQKSLRGIPGKDVVAQAKWVVAETAKAKRRAEELQTELRKTEGEIEEMKKEINA